jgi:hypothetical protein
MLKQVQKHDIIDLIAIWATRPEDFTSLKYWLNLVNIFLWHFKQEDFVLGNCLTRKIINETKAFVFRYQTTEEPCGDRSLGDR